MQFMPDDHSAEWLGSCKDAADCLAEGIKLRVQKDAGLGSCCLRINSPSVGDDSALPIRVVLRSSGMDWYCKLEAYDGENAQYECTSRLTHELRRADVMRELQAVERDLNRFQQCECNPS